MNDEKDLVIKYALESPENLRIALMIEEHIEDVKKTVISEFAKKIEKELKNKLEEDWEIQNELTKENCFNKRKKDLGIQISKKNWNNKYSIRLEAENMEDFGIGIKREKEAKSLKNSNVYEQLKKEMKENFDNWNQDYWDWGISVSETYKNWTNHDTMWLLDNEERSKEVLEYFVNLFLNVKKLVAEEMDKAIKEQSKR